MTFTDLAPELVHHIYNSLSTISDVINLSATCRRLNFLLRHSQKLPTLFTAAEREFGPLEDIAQLVTYNTSQAVHNKREPTQSYTLLRQMIKIGSVAKKIENIYPSKRWETDFLNRRSLTAEEAYSLRKAVYRYWLYCEVFQNRSWSRSQRLLLQAMEERTQLLRLWSTKELVELEDIRLIIEDLVSAEICPTDSGSRNHFNDLCDFSDMRRQYQGIQYCQPWASWPPTHLHAPTSAMFLFHNQSEEHVSLGYCHDSSLPVPQRRKIEMTGWGDEIAQYYVVQSMMKLTPAQILHLYEHASTKRQVEAYVANFGEEWFWNNGQTFLDTWTLVLAQRGMDPGGVREKIMDGQLGIASSGKVMEDIGDVDDCWQ